MRNQKIYSQRFKDLEGRNNAIQILTKFFFQKFIDENDTVLDFGSGYCEFINNIKCKEKYAVDIEPGFEKYASTNVKFLRNDGLRTKIPNSSVDKIFVSNVFEHIERDKIPYIIETFLRILKKNGQVLVLQPNIRFLSKDYWMFFDHKTPIDDRALEEIFSIYGFTLKYKILKFLPYTTKNKLPKSAIFIHTYIALPFLWKFFGKQTFLIFEK